MRKKTKTKRKSSSLKKRKKIKIDLRAEGAAFWSSAAGKEIAASAKGLPHGTVINVFDEARKIKNFNQLERFIDTHIPGVEPHEAAVAVARFARDNWLLLKILKDPDAAGSVANLFEAINKNKGGAPAIFNSKALKIFCEETGYKKPPAIKTFQNDVTTMKEFFGLKRKKKIVPIARGDKEFKI